MKKIIVDDELNLVCKIAFPNQLQRKQFYCEQLFEREAFFYNKIVSEFLKFQIEQGLSENGMFNSFPKCYKAIYEPEKELFIIILADIRPQGYQMWQRGRLANIENAQLIICELAKFHAISFAMRDQRPKNCAKFEHLNDLWPNFTEPGIIRKIWDQNIHKFIKILDKPEHKQIYEKFEKYEKVFSFMQ